MRQFKNRYYAFRHGESLANVEGIIVSDPVIGCERYGLSARGREQVRVNVNGCDAFDCHTRVISSDFKRTVETAEVICEQLGARGVTLDVRLRERYFGTYDGCAHDQYATVWAADAYDCFQEMAGAESPHAVRSRMWSVVEELEGLYAGETIILVSHGDPLLLLQTAFLEMRPGEHRNLPGFKTGGWRLLNAVAEA
jgi:glucosyl-3-phosphoglycerate phosphatase